jgi:putative sterol carrier protein
MRMFTLALAATGLISLSTQAAPLMSAEWAQQACQLWNTTPSLTNDLFGKPWLANDAGRGYKIVQMYRKDCGAATRTELKIEPKDGKAICTYGGKPQTAGFNGDKDYVMMASTKSWKEMGAGEYGPKSGMFFHGFRFDGPYAEAMGVMGAFEAFVLFPGKIPGDDSCPAK